MHKSRGLLLKVRTGLFASFVMLTCLGCSSGMYSVEGKIVYADGKPASELVGGTVMVDNPEARVSALGQIDKEGAFRLTTTNPNDGALPGTYRVAISERDPDGPPEDDRPQKKRRALVLPKYRNPETSGLTMVVEKINNNVTLTIERAP